MDPALFTSRHVSPPAMSLPCDSYLTPDQLQPHSPALLPSRSVKGLKHVGPSFTKLCHTAEQSKAVKDVYGEKPVINFRSYDRHQPDALRRLASLSLSLDPDPAQRWSIVNTETLQDKKNGLRYCRLYQCCIAHIWVCFCTDDKTILEISGISEHDPACKNEILAREGRLPLHEEVVEWAVSEMKKGVDRMRICEDNKCLIAVRTYTAIKNFDESTSNFLFTIETQHHRTLTRRYWASLGIDIRRLAEFNIHDWAVCDEEWFCTATFSYSARKTQSALLTLGIMTEEMKDNPIKFGHRWQLIMDGTFGVCSKMMSLFILMVLDEQGKGMRFSALPKHTFTAGSYGTEVLTRMLMGWKNAVSESMNKPFAPRLVTTDTDVKECNVALAVHQRREVKR
ncbi:hypothetical protein JCM5296_007222 [Sporobolomyces johnsonii]